MSGRLPIGSILRIALSDRLRLHCIALVALFALALAGLPHAPAQASGLKIFAPAAAFRALQGLVGDWQGRTESGRAFRVSYRLIANDSVLVESWTMSPTRTSMTVYHMDGENLIAPTIARSAISRACSIAPKHQPNACSSAFAMPRTCSIPTPRTSMRFGCR